MGLNAEMRSVGLQVADELVFRGILGEASRERHERQLTEVPGEVKAQAVVGSVLPERSNAV